MSTQIKNTVATAATNAVLDILAQQPWYRRYANTITTAATAVVTFGTWLATAEVGLPHSAQIALGLLVLVASVVAARATKNGTTPRGAQVVIDGIVESVTDAITPGDGSLDQLVKDKASEAANSVAAQATQAAKDIITGGHSMPGVNEAISAGISEAERAFLGRGR